MKKNEKLSVKHYVYLLHHLVELVFNLFENNLVHTDIKPQNIVLLSTIKEKIFYENTLTFPILKK